MKKIIFFSFISPIVLLIACTKMDVPAGSFTLNGILNPNTYDIRFYPPGLDIIKLPLNRYFIYKDSASGVIDSVVVIKSSVEIKHSPATSGYPGMPALNYESYTLFLMQFPGNGLWFTGNADCDMSCLCNSVDSSFNFQNGLTGLPAYWYSFSSYGSNQYSLIPALTIEGNTYAQVHCFLSTNGFQPSQPNYLAITFYWVKGTGIIKREIRTNNSIKTSLLLRYG